MRISWSLKSCFALLSVLTCATSTLKSEWLEFPPLCPQINQATPSQIETSVQLTLRPVEHARCTLWACPRLVPNVCSWPHSLAAPTGLGLHVLALACEAARREGGQQQTGEPGSWPGVQTEYLPPGLAASEPARNLERKLGKGWQRCRPRSRREGPGNLRLT